MGIAAVGRAVFIAGAVVGTIGAAVLTTTAIAHRVPSAVASDSPFTSTALSPLTARRPAPADAPSHPGVQVTVPALTEAGRVQAEPLATLDLAPSTPDSPSPSPPVVAVTSPPVTSGTAAAPPIITSARTTAAATVAPASPTTMPVATSPGTTSPVSTSPVAAAPVAPGVPATLAGTPATTSPRTPAARVPSQYQHLVGWVGTGKVVSLTFDDGPSQYSGQVLDVLRRYGIKATFCQIGQQVGQYPAIEARIKAEGHTLCNHSWDHDEALPSKSVAVIDAEISRTQQAIRALTGVTPRYYRAPGGDWGKTSKLRLELARFHTIPLAWADDSLDWTKPGVAAIVHTVLTTVSPGAIVLLHDGGGNRAQTIAALPNIITGLEAAGYRFVVLPADPSP